MGDQEKWEGKPAPKKKKKKKKKKKTVKGRHQGGDWGGEANKGGYRNLEQQEPEERPRHGNGWESGSITKQWRDRGGIAGANRGTEGAKTRGQKEKEWGGEGRGSGDNRYMNSNGATMRRSRVGTHDAYGKKIRITRVLGGESWECERTNAHKMR